MLGFVLSGLPQPSTRAEQIDGGRGTDEIVVGQRIKILNLRLSLQMDLVFGGILEAFFGANSRRLGL